MTLQDEIRNQLTGPGGPFELVEETVLGQRMQVFRTRHRSIRELLMESAIHGDKEYIVHGERRISFAEHLRSVASVARGLSENYDIQKGDRVGIAAANCAEWVIAFWAVTSLGGIVTAYNGLWTADELAYGIAHAEPRLVICDRKRLARIDRTGTNVPSLEIESQFAALEATARDADLPDVPIAEDDPCLILYTSGTTGKPKGAVVSHRALIGFVKTQTLHGLERIMLAMREGSVDPATAPAPLPPRSLVTVPLFHLSGLYANVIMMLAQGATTVYRAARFDAEDVMRTMQRERVTIWSALGSSAHQVLAHEALGRYDLSSIRNVGFGGAPTSPDLQRRVAEAFPNARGNLGMGYGLSESGGMGAVIGGKALEARPTSTGRAAAGHSIEIRDEHDRPVPTGHYGEVHIRSPYLMLGYWRNEEATAKAIKPGRWLATGDVGRLDADGYLYIDSRARDMILRSGENIYPVEIEHRIDAHPSVGECAVVGVDHEALGQEVKAIVVPAAGHVVDPELLRAFTAETLAAYKVPTVWEIRKSPLPRNAAGKVLKNVLTGDAQWLQVEE